MSHPPNFDSMTKDERRAWREQDLERRKTLRQERQAPLIADRPSFSISLDGPSRLSLSAPSFKFAATLHYKSEPRASGRHILLPKDHGPLAKNAISRGYHCVYKSGECTPTDRVAQRLLNVNLKKPRDSTGRFIPNEKLDISAENGYVELAPGDILMNEISMDLSESSQWRQLLQVGEKYWLRYDTSLAMAQASSGGVGIPVGWRYGTLEVSESSPCCCSNAYADSCQEYKAKQVDHEDSVPIPLAASNTINFEVTE